MIRKAIPTSFAMSVIPRTSRSSKWQEKALGTFDVRQNGSERLESNYPVASNVCVVRFGVRRKFSPWRLGDPLG
jgi:hypothetical protein